MARTKRRTPGSPPSSAAASIASDPEQLLLEAQDRGDESLATGRYLITYREGAAEEAAKSLKAQGFSVADARDFDKQAVAFAAVGDVDTLVFPEIGVALVGASAVAEHGITSLDDGSAGGLVQGVEPEYFAFADDRQYLRGFLAAAHAIEKDLGGQRGVIDEGEEVEPQVLGATWGLVRCKVPPTIRSGAGIKVAVLDTGMDFGHPDFAGRSMTPRSFVPQPPQDLHGHGTHCIGTACGPKAPPGSTPRYGIAHLCNILVGKVLTNSGTGTTSGILAGINWAIANGCQVISMSLGAQTGVQLAYTAAGAAALARGCLVVAAAGNDAAATGAPANSPTVMSVASVGSTLVPSAFSNRGKIDIAGPGEGVFSSVPRPTRYGNKSGTSMATPHVSGCAALWAQTSASLRGLNLWRQLQSSALRLPYPTSRVGSGLVQAP